VVRQLTFNAVYLSKKNNKNINQRNNQYYQERQGYEYIDMLMEHIDLDNKKEFDKAMCCNYMRFINKRAIHIKTNLPFLPLYRPSWKKNGKMTEILEKIMIISMTN
jgi:hypothetical protein